MSVVTGHTSTVAPSTATPPALWRSCVLAAALAAGATEAFTAVLRAAGVDLAAGNIGGTRSDVVEIGPGACAIMVLLCVVIGLAIAAAADRWAHRPQRTWRITTTALTAASLVPDAFAGATSTSTKVSLMAAHVIAAAIVIPLVARSLRAVR